MAQKTRRAKLSPPKLPKMQPTGRQLAATFTLLDLLYDKDAKQYRGGANDKLISDATGVKMETVARNRKRDYGPVNDGSSEKPRSDAQLLRLVDAKLDKMIDLLEILTKD